MKEGAISARKEAQTGGLRMKKSALQVRQNGRVTFDRRKGPSPVLSKKDENPARRLAN